MKVRECRESGKRATGYVCARPKPPSNTARETSPANDVDPIDPIDTLVARFNERSAGLLRELLSDLRASQRRPAAASTRHRIAPEDLEPVDELTRARARQLLAKHADPPRGRR